jgi:hypothetical protein
MKLQQTPNLKRLFATLINAIRAIVSMGYEFFPLHA